MPDQALFDDIRDSELLVGSSKDSKAYMESAELLLSIDCNGVNYHKTLNNYCVDSAINMSKIKT